MAGRSHVVSVTVVGLAGLLLAGRLIPSGQQMRYNTYRSRAECERDYTPAQCSNDGSSNSGSSGGFSHGYTGGGWRGPSYYADRAAPEAKSDPGSGRYGLRAGFVNASLRGGFGAIGRALHAGG